MKEEEFNSDSNLSFRVLNLYRCKNMTHLPSNLQVSEKLIICECPNLKSIDNIKCFPARSIYIRDCPEISYIPDNLRVDFLTLKRCPRLNRLPDGLRINGVLALHEMTFHSDFPKNIKLNGIDILACNYTVKTPRLDAIEREIAIYERTWENDLEYR